ncbi:MAG: diguanylate cyclase [Desulfobacteraceae bacterium]|jgi:diguanylate cyclase (GGDEF)-like protein|nr:MAG: diguanylate cyclase [Desulfobacteraceae bacterium]
MVEESLELRDSAKEQKVDYSKELILIVDDEEALCEVVCVMLDIMGFKTNSVNSAAECFKEIGKNKYTFVITDISMPGMDGLDLIRILRKQRPELGLIAMTGYTKEYSYVDVINAGANDFINKPFAAEELEAKLRRVIMEREMSRELSRLSITDPVTGLFNHRHFFNRLREEIPRARRQNHPLTLILLDLDDFKIFNDSKGHLAGDQLLEKVGNLINAKIRLGVDSGYRYGGDEFAILLVDVGGESSISAAKRIADAMSQELGVTASFGVGFLEPGMSAEDLVAATDERMYQNKKERRVGR